MTDVQHEINCISSAYDALKNLTPDERLRAIKYLNDRLDCEWEQKQAEDDPVQPVQ